MRKRTKVGAAVAAGVVAAAAGALGIGALRWQRDTARAVGDLDGGDAAPGGQARYSRADLHGLPEPVVRYFEHVLVPGQPMVVRARVEHEGEFQSRPGRWDPFTSVEEFAVVPPGYVWDASIGMLPLVPVRVRDGYIGGVGSMHARVGGLVTMVSQQGGREMAEATLQRYLAEATWFPTALLPRSGVRWTPLDDSTARATISDGGVSASVDVHFTRDGTIARMTTDRYRADGDQVVLTPWEGTSDGYERHDGMLIPTTGDAAYVIGGIRRPYWRGRLRRAAYRYAR